MLLFHANNLPHHGLERTFALAAQAGFNGMEIEINQNVDTHNPAYLKELAERYKLPIKAFSLDIKKDEALIKAFQSTVREFTNCTLNLHPANAFSFKYQRWLKEIAPKLAKKYQHQLCFRNLPPETMFGFLPKRKDNHLDGLKVQGGVCLDLTALALANEDVIPAIQRLGGKLRHVYLSNFYHRVPYSLPNQQGVLPLESFLTKLAQIDYKADFTVKVNSKALHEGNEEMTLKKMVEAVTFYQQYFQVDGQTAAL